MTLNHCGHILGISLGLVAGTRSFRRHFRRARSRIMLAPYLFIVVSSLSRKRSIVGAVSGCPSCPRLRVRPFVRLSVCQSVGRLLAYAPTHKCKYITYECLHPHSPAQPLRAWPQQQPSLAAHLHQALPAFRPLEGPPDRQALAEGQGVAWRGVGLARELKAAGRM